jgi:hypothetical protein
MVLVRAVFVCWRLKLVVAVVLLDAAGCTQLTCVSLFIC